MRLSIVGTGSKKLRDTVMSIRDDYEIEVFDKLNSFIAFTSQRDIIFDRVILMTTSLNIKRGSEVNIEEVRTELQDFYDYVNSNLYGTQMIFLSIDAEAKTECTDIFDDIFSSTTYTSCILERLTTRSIIEVVETSIDHISKKYSSKKRIEYTVTTSKVELAPKVVQPTKQKKGLFDKIAKKKPKKDTKNKKVNPNTTKVETSKEEDVQQETNQGVSDTFTPYEEKELWEEDTTEKEEIVDNDLDSSSESLIGDNSEDIEFSTSTKPLIESDNEEQEKEDFNSYEEVMEDTSEWGSIEDDSAIETQTLQQDIIQENTLNEETTFDTKVDTLPINTENIENLELNKYESFDTQTVKVTDSFNIETEQISTEEDDFDIDALLDEDFNIGSSGLHSFGADIDITSEQLKEQANKIPQVVPSRPLNSTLLDTELQGVLEGDSSSKVNEGIHSAREKLKSRHDNVEEDIDLLYSDIDDTELDLFSEDEEVEPDVVSSAFNINVDIKQEEKERDSYNKVKIVEKIVEKKNNAVGSIFKGIKGTIIVVSGDRGTGVTTMVNLLAEFFSSKVDCLVCDFDWENHGLLNKLDYHAFSKYPEENKNSLKYIQNTTSLINLKINYADGIDIITTDYGTKVTAEEMEVTQSIITDVAKDYGVVIVDVPIRYLPYCKDLISNNFLVFCVDWRDTFRGLFNLYKNLDEMDLSARYKRGILNKATVLGTPKLDIKKATKEILDNLSFESYNWTELKYIPVEKSIDDKVINKILEG